MQTRVWSLEIYEPAVKISQEQWGLFSLDARDSIAASNQSLGHSVGRGSGGRAADEIMSGSHKGVESLRGKKKKSEHILGRSFVKRSWLAPH